MTQRPLLAPERLTGRTDDPAVLEALEVDYTPAGVAVQLLLAALALGVPQPRRALDPSAGSGGWGRAMRAVFGPDVHLVGVEPRESEAANLVAAYDEAHTTTCDEYLRDARGNTPPFDLVATNPPFSAFKATCFWPIEILRAGVVHAQSWIMLYGLTQWGQTDAAEAAMRAWPPVLQLRLGGRVEHRGKSTQRLAKIPKRRRVPGGPTHEWRKNGGDSKEYSAWLWSCEDGRTRRERYPSWRTVQLPVLHTDLRRWSPEDIPGCSPIDPALVQRIRGEL